MKARMLATVLLPALFLLVSGEAREAPEGGDSWVIKTWMIEEGLPHNSVLSFCQTRDGFIWLGTEMGLVRFNGSEFRVANTWNTPGLTENRITAIVEDRQGRLWVGTGGGGIVQWQEGDVRSYGMAEGLPGQVVRALLAGSGGETWAGTDGGLALFSAGGWSRVELTGSSSHADVSALLLDQKGRLWAGGAEGLWRQVRSGKAFEKISSDPVQALAQDRRGRIWLGLASGLAAVGADSGQPEKVAVPLSGSDVRVLLAEGDGSLLVGTQDQGVIRLQDDQVQALGRGQGLPDDTIQTLNRDAQGNLWVGTMAGGLSRIRSRVVSVIGRDQGLPTNRVLAVLQSETGVLWVGTSQGLWRRDAAGAWTSWLAGSQAGSGEPPSSIQALCSLPTGDLLVVTNRGLWRLVSSGPGILPEPGDGLPPGSIRVLHLDAAGALWVGSEEGLYVRPAGELRFSREEGLAQVPVNALASDGRGRLWVGTARGLYAGVRGSFRQLFSEDEVLAVEVSQTVPDMVWAGLSRGGLLAVEKEKAKPLLERDGLPSNHISLILEASAAQSGQGAELWLGSPRGVCRLLLSRVRERLSGGALPLLPVFLSEDDGVIRGESSEEGRPAACRGAGKTLFFATSQGLLQVDRDKWTLDSALPPGSLDEVRFDNRVLSSAGHSVLPPGQHLMEFYFSALDYSAPSKARLLYRLDPFDANWKMVEPGKKGSAIYYNLKSGRYRFRMLCGSGDGRWNEAERIFSFRIQSSFPLMLVLIPLLALLAAGAGLYGQKKKNAEEEVEPRKKYQTSALTPDRADEIVIKLKKALDVEKVYLSPSLTLKKLAEKLMVHPNHLSQIINERFNQSFNDFINRYRIEEARKRLLDPDKGGKSILDIAYEVGFYSKSVFNTAFKKFSGKTPSDFRSDGRKE